MCIGFSLRYFCGFWTFKDSVWPKTAPRNVPQPHGGGKTLWRERCTKWVSVVKFLATPFFLFILFDRDFRDGDDRSGQPGVLVLCLGQRLWSWLAVETKHWRDGTMRAREKCCDGNACHINDAMSKTRSFPLPVSQRLDSGSKSNFHSSHFTVVFLCLSINKFFSSSPSLFSLL